MKLVQELTYKLARPVTMLAIAGASLFASCSKDNDGLKGKRTVYKFSLVNIAPIENLEQIAASADSAEVVEIIFEPDEREPWSGVGMQYFYDHGIVPAFQAAKGKGKGKGTYREVDDDEDNHAIEPEYKKLGFKFTYRKENQR